MNNLFKIKFLLETSLKSLFSYGDRLKTRRAAPAHILFCTVDHYEPVVGYVDFNTEVGRVNDLSNRYPELVKDHRDSAGNLPKRTWFFAPHCHRYHSLKKLVRLCENGYGEIELHLHHGKTMPDTPDGLEATIRQCIKEYSYFGIFGTEGGIKRYGFIHGDWALDNSIKGKYCGVNNEIDILIKTGCYADFTFPSMNEANPAQINSIYYAKDDPVGPKSYNRGIPVRRNGRHNEGLMMIEGPLSLFFKTKSLFGLRTLSDSIDCLSPVTERHIKLWIDTGVHIKGQPNVIFVKTHIHGAAHGDLVLGDQMKFLFDYLERNYNDGSKYILHYVTAREMYNIVKALEDGHGAERIEDFRNYKVKAPVYDSSPDIPEASKELQSLVYKTYA